MDDLRTALIVLGALFVGGLALWERRRASRRAGTTILTESGSGAAPALMTRRMEPSIEDFSGPGASTEIDTLDVPIIHPTEQLRVDVSKESAVDVPAAARMEATPSPPPPAPTSGAVAIRWPPAHTERVLSLRVVPAAGELLSGRALRQALESAGMQHGPQRIFHLVDAAGHVLASAANLVRPGSFIPEEMDAQQYRGLSVFTILPGPRAATVMLEGLVRVARDVASRIEAVVQDEQGAPLDAERLTQLRRSVQGYAETGESPP
jgi:FtsZ-interacting cell division protein ZipA